MGYVIVKPWKHQLEIADQGYTVLKDNGLVYLAMEERTGKSGTAILIAELANNIKTVLIITKKKALEGWADTLLGFEHTKKITLTNYHQMVNMKDNYDLIIFDEAHNYISSFPKVSKMWSHARRLARGKPIIYLSATPHAQSRAMLYHQFALSDWSPWKQCKSFRSWHAHYGVPYSKYISGREIAMYDHVDDEAVAARVEHLFITKTRKELGFEHEPEDSIHMVPLEEDTINLYNTILKDKVYQVGEDTIVCDSVMKLRTSLHMLEGGVAKTTIPGKNTKGDAVLKDKYLCLANMEKINHIKDTWGDSNNIVIMYNYIAEGEKLRAYFKKATILQATSNAEGIDLSKMDHLIIYSQDFSTARHTQRRARQANLFRATPIIVHFLLVKKGISEEVYNTVSINKINYVDSVFTGKKL